MVERRITELYTKAADQLGSDKAPVRLAGLDALERLAQDNESQRQTIVNVLCAYLRMPYDARLTAVPSSSGDVGAEGAPGREEIREHSQERQARLTARRILADHLRPARDHPAVTFWGDTDLDLTGATIIGFEMIDCHVRAARFGVARFAGGAVLGANFTERAVFDGAWMRGPGSFPACWTLSTTRGVRWPDAEGEWRLLVRKPVAPGPEPDGTAAAEPVQS